MAEFGDVMDRLTAGAQASALPPPQYSALLVNTLVILLTAVYVAYLAYDAARPYWSLLRPRYRRFARVALAAMRAREIKKKQ